MGHGFQVSEDAPAPLPWSNANVIAVRSRPFSLPIEQHDLSLRSAAGVTYNVTSFAYNPATGVATWTLDKPLAAYPFTRRTADRVALLLRDFGFATELVVVPGDANRNGVVTAQDYGAVRLGFATSTTDEGASPRHYSVFRDINGSGAVTASDLGTARGNLGAKLPGPLPLTTPRDADDHVTATEELL